MFLSPLVLPLRPIGVAATGVALAALLVGCGSDDAATDAAASNETSTEAGDRPGDAPARMPGTSGEIAAVNGDVLQVRSQLTGQVAVTVTGATTITEQAAGTLADVERGVCVVVRRAATDGASAGSEMPTEIDAASVSVTEAGEDGCEAAGGFGGRPGAGGERPTAMPTDLPSGMPTDLPSGMPGGDVRMDLGAIGEVTSVTSAGFVVKGIDGDVTVTVGDDTTYTKQVAANASALEVGRCARVDGEADDAGAVTAESIQVSDAVGEQCGR